MTETRKLAAILAADVVGYSRLAGADEDRTLARLRALRSDLMDPTIAVHHGRVVKRTGDGILVEFRSVVDAVRCAIEVQNGMIERNAGLPTERRIEFRVGIHLGDVVEESDGDLMGDGINIAARLEGIAKPGAVCLSEDAYRQVKSRLGLAVNDLGPTQLKNIAEPVRVYSLEIGVPAPVKPAPQAEAAPPEKLSARLALPDKPSIAVLAFQNMSGDPEQEYFADGMVEDIITALSRMSWLFVIARNSSFTYKGKAVDVKQVGRELGVRYVLEGSVRKAGNKVRITGQLIEASTGVHLWANRFEGELEDIFDLQDEVTTSVIGSIAPKLEKAEIERAKRKPTENLAAYDYFLRGMANIYQGTKEGNLEALQNFQQAIDMDQNFPSAYGMCAYCYVWRKANGWLLDEERATAETEQLARKATSLGADDATAWRFSGWIKVRLGEPELAIEQLERAARLSPLDPFIFIVQNGIVAGHFFAGRYEEALAWAQKTVRLNPNYVAAIIMLAVSAALAGREQEMRKAIGRLQEVDPTSRMSNFKNWLPLRRPEDAAAFEKGLRLTGLTQ
jgi:TolB-like protein/class 3 adenylate cyclase/Tfp pilus assembly protein PilF